MVAGGKIDRQEIAAIVDRFLAGKRLEPSSSPLPPPVIEAEAGSMYTVPVPTGNSGQYNFTDIGIQTEMSVPEGKTVVVGKAGAAGPIRGLFLVMTAKVVE